MEYGFKMKRLTDQFSRRILEPQDIASLVVFRVGFGLLMFWEVTRFFFILAGLKSSTLNHSFIFNMSGSVGSYPFRVMACTCSLQLWEFWP